MQNCQADYFSETLFIVSHYFSEPLNYTAATNFYPSIKFKYLGPLAGSKDNLSLATSQIRSSLSNTEFHSNIAQP